MSKIFHATQKVYIGFRMCSKDFNPMHNDEELAKSKSLHINYL